MTDKNLTDVTDNNVGKMSDNEIKKALECCKSSRDFEGCKKCPMVDLPDCYEGGAIVLSTAIVKHIEDLINRLEAENERLTHITRNLVGEIKAEAYTEFADLLCGIWQRFEDENICGISNQGLVKFVCKEMVGEDNALGG